ncbi:glycerophosphodiester phosphodiesterase GDPD4 isoform X3 [Amaranthus tricolor]|uniref:glycerophosphodiester phosphodiesterase GDPD4 isoform X3 n=1 Tax=Amaranthus tricolor TaxID=29722 RepID=UPI002583A4AC|nr:glycerophosphodiester phosphodiesterase GDPD4 isoform X3 [Amaranthus tricolor]
MRRRQQSLLQSGLRTGDFHLKWRRAWRRISGKRGVLILILMLLVIALAPPLFFHFRLTRLQKTQMKNCGWMRNPPLVCAHGGDSVNAFPNTMAAYRSALLAGADCIEIDVSRSADGFLFALHDRELQRISGNHTSRVGYMSMKEINELDAALHFPKVLDDQKVPTLEDALRVGYIIMKDPQTRSRSNLLRLKKAGIAGIYHPLINEQLIQILRWGNKKIYAWTVDDLNSMQHMLVDSVDAVVTSNPALLQQLMQNTRIRCLEDGFSLP